MGLFDSIAGQVLNSMAGQSGQPGQSGQTGDAQPGLMEALGGLLGSGQGGGLAALVSAFEQQGLGGVIASWIGTGQNQAISAEQIQAVLGSEQVQALAQKLGFSTQDVAAQLAQLLPQVVDRLTPDGTLPQGGGPGGVAGGALGSLPGMLGGARG
ncbi:MAG: DUF937 domain-containing protein [Burkholderiales bacterium]|nr:DUF937 domain-containing protein [Burkholderiales bacterium]